MSRRRLLYLIPASVSVATAVLAIVALLQGISATGQLFPGFFFHINGTVAALQRGGWEGPAAGMRSGDRVALVNGQVVRNGDDLRAWLSRRAPGDVAEFEVWRGGQAEPRHVRIRLRHLTTEDILATFVLPYGIGVVYLLIGAVVFFVKRTYEAALAMSVCVVASVYHMTTFDAHTTRTLVRLWVAYPLLGAVSVHLFSVFPATRPRFHRAFVLALAYGMAALALGVVQVKMKDPSFAAVSSQLPAGYLVVCFALDVLMLGVTIRVGPSEAIRNKARTILVGLILAATLGVVFVLLVRNYPELITAERAMMLSALFPVLLAYALIKKNLFDMEFVLRTTATYAVATALVLGLYFAVVFAIGSAASALTRRYAGAASVTGAVLSTMVVALVFHPLRIRVQRVVDRFFFREKGQLQDALAQLVKELPSEAPDLRDLAGRLTGRVRALMRCRFVALLCPDQHSGDLRVVGVGGEAGPGAASLVLPRDHVEVQRIAERDEPLQSWSDPERGALAELLERGEVLMVVPLRTADTLAGVMLLGPRQYGDVFTRFELHLLRTLTPSMALVVQNALLVREHAEKERLAALGKLSAVIIHEIKNPLGIIRVSSGTLKKRFPPEDSGHELASFIEEEVVRMNDTIAQFLSFARPQSPTLAPFDLSELVQRTAAAAQEQFRAKGLSLSVALDRPVEVLADARQVQQVLLNLLNNARQALEGREDGWVEVEVSRRARGGARVSVTDNGPGITPANRERIFEPFFTTRRGGTGLGLAIARQLLGEQGGQIGLEPREQGACFVVILPGARM